MSERAWLIEVFRLHYQEQLSQNRIAKQLGLSRSTVNSCFQRAIKAGVRWPVNELTLERNCLIELHTLRAELRAHFDDIIHALDPLKLLETIRLYQHQLARIAVGDPVGDKTAI
ncbi:winged helix-turn-helix transcriptional regulator [Klebsiella quasipneumoniae]|uniref:sigma factor-like helix-turn-helix DNA-binding protein n=1 Tax=Klebsiella quasipneumoniae TaxID=1463165 RepID=UPI0019163940|nr:sigma factor-like helix-turn-helix DNA-binding protein [Klebsiella quasipneumoniae]QQM79403.1 winged helix-turn-helix transcriptional regulator [Klebsiella quasipneumoniae]